MSRLARNIVSNLTERILTTLLTIAVVPFQVRLLGIEAYGVLGFVTSLQVLFNILDLGLTPTIVREVASDSSRARSETRLLVRSLSSIYWTIAVCFAAVIWAGSRWLAAHWLRVATLQEDVVVLAIRLIAGAILLRWPMALYAGILTGGQRLDIVNLIRMAASVVRLAGGLVVIVAFRSLAVYLAWVLFSTALELAAYMAACTARLPGLSLRPGFSQAALQRVWRFSAHMNGISILSAVLVQSDRLVISRLLPVSELGFYSIAYTAALGLSMLQSVVTTALFPALAEQTITASSDEVQARCRVCVQLLMYAVSGFACLLIFFGEEMLAIWISGDAAARSAQPLRVLAVGFMFSASVSVPQTLAIALGRTGWSLTVNVFAAVVYVPLLAFLVHRWGIGGAAWAWVALNACYLVILVPLLRRDILMESTVRWFTRNVLPFVLSGAVAFGVAALVAWRIAEGERIVALLAAGAAGPVYAAVGFFFVDRNARARVLSWRAGARALTSAPLS